jgi:hypothetical protein
LEWGWNSYISPVSAVASVDEEVDGAVGHNHQSVGRLALVADYRPGSVVERLGLEEELVQFTKQQETVRKLLGELSRPAHEVGKN